MNQTRQLDNFGCVNSERSYMSIAGIHTEYGAPIDIQYELNEQILSLCVGEGLLHAAASFYSNHGYEMSTKHFNRFICLKGITRAPKLIYERVVHQKFVDYWALGFCLPFSFPPLRHVLYKICVTNIETMIVETLEHIQIEPHEKQIKTLGKNVEEKSKNRNVNVQYYP